MTLYCVSTNSTPEHGDVYKVYIIAADKKHAERHARVVYWHGQKIHLSVDEVDMTQEMIVGFSQWYQ